MITVAVGLGAVTVARGQGWNVATGAFDPGGMMGSGGQVATKPISIDRAVGIAQQTAAGYSSRALTVDEVIEFQNNFYASIKEREFQGWAPSRS